MVGNLDVNCLKSPPTRIGLPDAPALLAPEKEYYTSEEDISATKIWLKNKKYDDKKNTIFEYPTVD